MDTDDNFQSIGYSPRTVSTKRLLLVFGTSFFIILVFLNSPYLFSYADYQIHHDEEKENEMLTKQYQRLYGYEAQSLTPSPAPQVKSQPSLLSIPKLNVDAPILTTTGYNEKEMLALLKQGVLLFPESANPGTAGPTVIIGHSSSDPPWTKYSNVFALLGRLEKGDLLYITFQGKTYAYAVIARQTGSVNEMQEAARNHAGELILSSCWPAGSTSGRVIITASLQK